MYEEYIRLLKNFIKFKSISTDPEFKDEVSKASNWLKEIFNLKGFKVEEIKGYGNPIILASFEVNSEFETCLIYGHYDVQPAFTEDGWDSDPFEVREVNDRLFARGIVDNKGQVLIHIATVFNLILKDKLKYNIKFIIEGDEESGSEEIERFFKDQYKKLEANFVLISDGELIETHPCLDTSFRGIFNCTLKVKTSQKDNHSGLYGGSLPNASTELVKILNTFHDNQGNLTIDGIDNNEVNISNEILKNNKKIPYSIDNFKKVTGAGIKLNDKIDFYTQTGYFTSVEITTIKSGYDGIGYRNSIPSEAIAKINFRLSPDLDYKNISLIFKKFLDKITPSYVSYDLKIDQGSNGVLIDIYNKYCLKAKEVLEETFNAECFYRPCGAIIPIALLMKEYLNVPLIIAGLGNEDCNMHGFDENFDIDIIKKGLLFSNKFFSK